MLSRRCLLGVSALALQGLAAPAIARGERVLRLGYLFAKNSHLGTGAEALATALATTGGSRYRIEQYPNGSLGGELEMAQALQRGHLDLAFLTNGPFGGIVPELAVLDLLFLFRDAPHAHAVFDGPSGHGLLRHFSAKGMVGLAWGENGMRHITNSKRRVQAPADLQGLKLRVPQSEVMLTGFRALGATAQPLGFPALYGALQSGEFDGQENPIAVITASGFGRVQKHLTLSGHVYSWAVVVMSEACWNSLPEADREAFRSAARAAGKVSREAAAEAERSGTEQLRRAGMEVVAGIDRAAFERALQPANASLLQRFGTELVERIRAVR